MQVVISIILYLLKHALCFSMWSFWKKKLHEVLNEKVNSFVFG